MRDAFLLCRQFWSRYVEQCGTPFFYAVVDKQVLEKWSAGNKDKKDAIFGEIETTMGAIYNTAKGVLTSDIELKSMDRGSNNNAHKELMTYINQACSSVILGADSVTNATPGKLGNETEASQNFQMRIQSDRKFVESQMRKILTMVAVNNNIDTKFVPAFVMFDDKDFTDDKIKTEIDINLTAMGVRPNKEYFIKRYKDLDESNFEIEKPTNAMQMQNKSNTKAQQMLNKSTAKENAGIKQVTDNANALHDFAVKFSKTEIEQQIQDIADEVVRNASTFVTKEDLDSNIDKLYTDAEESELKDKVFGLLALSDIYGIDTINREVGNAEQTKQ